MIRFTAHEEVWLDGERYDAGDHEVGRPTKALARLVGSAHHAGSVTVTEGLDDAHVQSQEDGEAAYAEAQGTADPVTGRWDGPWAEGNQLAYEAVLAARAEEADA